MRKQSGVSMILIVLLAFTLLAAACGEDTSETTAAPATTTTASSAEPLKFGMILVGPQNDRGWSQAHFEAGQYLEEQLGAEMIVLDKVNSADLPDKTVDQVAQDMINRGAQLVFLTSDDMRDGALLAAELNPTVPMIWSSGDSAWAEGEAPAPFDNLGNIMGRMEFGKMIAGCAAGLTTQTGSIAYLGPLINDETRRLVNSAFLGASYCWENYRGETTPLEFTVNWIGFWFNIPGFTLDPTQVANGFLDAGADVIISGIDTTEALDVAGQAADAGESVWALPYDFDGACELKPEICLGVPYFNWGPAYLEVAQSVIDGTFTATWQWNGPDWTDLNNKETTAIGFVKGDGLSADNASTLDQFIAGLADGSINPLVGPLNYQDGSTYLADGETATDQQIWYTKQLLEGVTGPSE
ncbi:MAG: BMP family ABC transporter substrate-binding protein [Acidimicrobiia bacterium]|nr:BMP family ABC transporter substrate-binding protein [Acidimicrobiia bacterium]MDH3397153.1 BMP family ABC transporter substrate-binding protein [Acidimicrobiia bacterium]